MIDFVRPVTRWFYWECLSSRLQDIYRNRSVTTNDIQAIHDHIGNFGTEFSQHFGVKLNEKWTNNYTYQTFQKIELLRRSHSHGQAEDVFPRLYRQSSLDYSSRSVSQSGEELPSAAPKVEEAIESDEEYIVPEKTATA